MKHFNNILITFTLIFYLYSNNSFSQWIQTSGPYGDDISSITASGFNIYVGTAGFYSAIYNGLNWARIDTGLTDFHVTTLEIIGAKLFAGTEGGGMLISTDFGKYWTSVNNGLTNMYITSSAIVGNNIFIGTQNGVFTSVDDGNNWNSVNNGLKSTFISDITTSGSNLFVISPRGSVQTGWFYTLYTSTNNGINWLKVDSIFSGGINCALAANESKILFGVANELHCLTKIDSTWSISVLPTFQTASFTSLLIEGVNFLAASEAGVYLSSDAGVTWSPRNTGLKNLLINTMISENGNLYVGTFRNGVYFSSDTGNTWTSIDVGMNFLFSYSMSYEGTNLFAGTDNGVYMSTNKGNVWTPMNQGMISDFILCIEGVDSNLYAAGTHGLGRVYISVDLGESWTYSEVLGVRTLSNIESNLFAGTHSNGVYRSTNNGVNWIQVNDGLNNLEVRSMETSDYNLFIGTEIGIYLTTNYGEDWVSMIDTAYGVKSIAISDNNIFASTYTGMYRSTNNGVTWDALNFGWPHTSFYISSIKLSGSSIFCSTESGEVYLSKNNGTDWINVSDGLPHNFILSLAVDEINLYAGLTMKGVWRRPLSELVNVIGNENNQFNISYSLEQNYPNPFNPTTTISFSIPKSQNVELKVFDILGNEMVTLLNEYKEAGEYKIEFNARNLTSGIYFYQLKAGGFVQTKKLVLLK